MGNKKWWVAIGKVQEAINLTYAIGNLQEATLPTQSESHKKQNIFVSRKLTLNPQRELLESTRK